MRGHSLNATMGRAAAAGMAAAVVLAVASPVVQPSRAVAAGSQRIVCPGKSWVASWTTSPTDSFPTFGPTLQPTPSTMTDQTVRMVLTPHLGGHLLRLHLSNRFATRPLPIGHVTIARQHPSGAAISAPVEVTFAGSKSVTVPAKQDIVSDPVATSAMAFEPLAVSIYLPDASTPVTEHWNANATSYYADSGSGDLTGQTSAVP